VALGFIGWLVTGWPLALVIAPSATVGLPYLLSAPDAKERIERLEALEEWTRSLSGVLTVGIGLEQALITTLRSTPDAITDEVGLLVARLRAGPPGAHPHRFPVRFVSALAAPGP
jgi:Flp pilus assembly protein TadB